MLTELQRIGDHDYVAKRMKKRWTTAVEEAWNVGAWRS